MILARVSVKRPVFATMAIAALVVFGFIAWTRLPILLMPKVDFPILTVSVVLPGAGPETVESKITEILEESVSTVEGVKMLKSYSLENVSQLVIEFELSVDIDVAAQDVRDKIANVRRLLPGDIEPPLVQKLDFGAMPILQIAVSGNMPARELTEFVKDKVKPRFERIPGVGRVTLVGGRERQIRVWLDADKLRGYGLTADDVVRTLQLGNIEIPGGILEASDQELVVKTQGEVTKVDDFGRLIISSVDGKPVRVEDIGYVEDGEADARTFSRLNGDQALAVLVTKRSDANEIEVADRIYEEIEELNEHYKSKLNMVVPLDMTTFTREAIADINTTLIWGTLFAVLVILIFLRNAGATIITALAIPVSIISTFTFMLALGFSLNIITMMGLALSVGVLIDDAIVVIENIFRHREEGESPYKAAINATTEIGFAVLAATLTIIAVFVPVAFMTGIIGKFFYEFGLTVSIAVAVSLFTALTLTPMLSSKFLHRRKTETRFDKGFENIFSNVEKGYRGILEWSLSHRKSVLAIATALFIFVMFLNSTGLLETEFQPTMERDEYSVIVETPLGSTIEQTNAKIREIEEKIITMPFVTDIFSTVGVGQGEREEANKANIVVKMTPKEQRKEKIKDAYRITREVLADVKNAKITLKEAEIGNTTGFGAAQLQFAVVGSDLNELGKKSVEIMNRFAQIKGFVDLDTSYRAGKPEVELKINRSKAADLGVNVYSIASMVGTLVGGKEVTKYEEKGKQYEVWVRLQKEDRDQISDFDKLMIRSITGTLVDLGNLVEYIKGSGPSQIERLDRQRHIEIRANLDGMVLGTAVQRGMQEIGKIIEGTDMEVTLQGEAEVMEESFRTMTFTLMLAIILIYMVLASQFNSFVHPVTIMIALPLSIIGAFLLLILVGKTFNMMSFIGLILLMGLVTKNSILLIDLTQQYRRDGMPRLDALLKAAPRRLRPILMTAFSTILAAVPVAMAWGKGAEFRSPMAVAIIGGMFTATLLTLVVIPVVYTVLDDVRKWRLFAWLGAFVRKESNNKVGK